MSPKIAPAPKRVNVQILPNGNRLFVKPLANDSMSPGGILLPEQAQKNKETVRGEVISVGPGMYTQTGTRIAMPFKKGDIILFPRYCGNEVQIDRVPHLIITEPDVLATESTSK